MNARAVIGGNHPPEPIDQMEAIQAAYDNTFLMVQNWLDGGPGVETEAQMKEVDSLLASVKEAEKDALAAKEDEYRPHKAACDGVVARWKPFLTDLDRQKKGLTKTFEAFKKKRADELAAEKRRKEQESERLRREAEEKARAANPADLDATREADAALEAARRATTEARRAETQKGLRTFDVTEVLDGTAYARWLWQNDRDWLLETMKARAATCKHHIPGVVETRKDRRAV